MSQNASTGLYRRRHNWRGVIPQFSRGHWLQITWLFWTWDFVPGPNDRDDKGMAQRAGELVDDLRKKEDGQ